MSATQRPKPATVAALEQLTEAIRASRERADADPLTDPQKVALTEYLRAILGLVVDLDPEAYDYLVLSKVEDQVREIVDEEIAAGRLVDHGDGSYTQLRPKTPPADAELCNRS